MAVQDVCQPGGTLGQRWTRPRRGFPSARPTDGVSHFVAQGFRTYGWAVARGSADLGRGVRGIRYLQTLRSFRVPGRDAVIRCSRTVHSSRRDRAAIAELVIAVLLIPAAAARWGALLALIL